MDPSLERPATGCSPGSLGSGGSIRVLLMTKGGADILAEFTPTSGSFTRNINITSTLTMTVTMQGNDGCDLVTPWATEVCVLKDGVTIWCGPVIDVKFNLNSVELTARDLTIWWSRRTFHDDVTFTDEDAASVLVALHGIAMASDPVPNIFFDAPPSGATFSRIYHAAQVMYIKDAVHELVKAVLDWTVVGRLIVCRGQELAQVPGFTLHDDMWMTPPLVHARGADQATSISINAGGTLVGNALASSDYIAYYGLIERHFSDPHIRSQADADIAAANRLAILKDPYYIEAPAGAALRPSAPVSLEQLIPGARVSVYTQATCKKLIGDFRLETVTYDFAGSVSIDLQPLGTTDGTVTSGNTEDAAPADDSL